MPVTSLMCCSYIFLGIFEDLAGLQRVGWAGLVGHRCGSWSKIVASARSPAQIERLVYNHL
jgi:hypothetical protein